MRGLVETHQKHTLPETHGLGSCVVGVRARRGTSSTNHNRVKLFSSTPMSSVAVPAAPAMEPLQAAPDHVAFNWLAHAYTNASSNAEKQTILQQITELTKARIAAETEQKNAAARIAAETAAARIAAETEQKKIASDERIALKRIEFEQIKFGSEIAAGSAKGLENLDVDDLVMFQLEHAHHHLKTGWGTLCLIMLPTSLFSHH